MLNRFPRCIAEALRHENPKITRMVRLMGLVDGCFRGVTRKHQYYFFCPKSLPGMGSLWPQIISLAR